MGNLGRAYGSAREAVVRRFAPEAQWVHVPPRETQFVYTEWWWNDRYYGRPVLQDPELALEPRPDPDWYPGAFKQWSIQGQEVAQIKRPARHPPIDISSQACEASMEQFEDLQPDYEAWLLRIARERGLAQLEGEPRSVWYKRLESAGHAGKRWVPDVNDPV